MKAKASFSLAPVKPSVLHLQFAMAAALLGTQGIPDVEAFPIDTGNPDYNIAWDNTVKYSAAWRVENQDNAVRPAYNPNLDDGDNNFNRGLISDRLDILSELDMNYQHHYGLRVSGAGWYDDVYNHSNDNTSDTVNSASVASDHFTHATRRLQGRDAEFLDAFGYGKFDLGDMSLSLRGGSYSQLYGESLFFGGNGIAVAQSPVDINKLLAVPNSTFKEIIRPVGQVGGTLLVNQHLTLGAYYQYKWQAARLPAAGSYFSFADFVGDGGQQFFIGPGQALQRGRDVDPSNSGQYGFQVKLKFGEFEYGLYAARYHDKFPQFYLRPTLGEYDQVYAEGIRTFGASVSTLIGETNVAAETSIRRNTPLAAIGNVVLDLSGTGDGDHNPLYPVGNTFHAQVSAISVLAGSSLWDGATLLGEVAYNRVTSVDKNRDQLDPNVTTNASSLRMLFTPEYFQVFPGVDMTVPVGIGYGINGNTAVLGTGFSPEGGGDVSLGLQFDYRKTWRGGLSFTHYYGSAGGIVDATQALSGDQVYADRDFVAISLQRTF
ncbi:DUF1302 domain-containing protein [Pseudomonas sp. NA-150]|uniref:DUF1302 domain-containing protein n=1 Tax=Pseudomonas sp. NA-150 TaxID=3367525 RepID=UPI0037C7FDB6